ncbi:MAG: RluA family pseudouridine synthase [Patescibacteria group bacterium]|jgi:23S rRNA pseudouridine1911/1915/1917 synthase
MDYKVKPEFIDERLDKFLVKKFPNLSRAQIQKAITDGHVLVNNQKPSKHRFLKADDLVNIDFNAEELEKKSPAALQPNADIKLNILFEDENYIIVNKPANQIVHPAEHYKNNDTLAHGLLAHFPGIALVGEDKTRPGIVHRLDKEVSGVLAVPKTQEAFLHLKKQFQDRSIYKEYIALVYGKMPQNHDYITFNIERSKTRGHKMAAKPDNSGKEAVTEYEVTKEYALYSLLKVIIHTGRTHQIRVHLNALSHPIIGDELYCPKNLKNKAKINRIFLHAHILKFKNMQGEELSFKAALPDDLKVFLEKIK